MAEIVEKPRGKIWRLYWRQNLLRPINPKQVEQLEQQRLEILDMPSFNTLLDKNRLIAYMEVSYTME